MTIFYFIVIIIIQNLIFYITLQKLYLPKKNLKLLLYLR